jgi:hypothetical protein
MATSVIIDHVPASGSSWWPPIIAVLIAQAAAFALYLHQVRLQRHQRTDDQVKTTASELLTSTRNITQMRQLDPADPGWVALDRAYNSYFSLKLFAPPAIDTAAYELFQSVFRFITHKGELDDLNADLRERRTKFMEAVRTHYRLGPLPDISRELEG